MTSPNAADTAGRPDPTALAADGIKLVSRYLAPVPNPKVVTAAEITALHAAGIAVLLNWESSGTRAQGGAANGTQDGAQAAAMAETLGAPHGLTIFYSVDFDALPADYPAVKAYFSAVRAATAGRYGVGVYGSGNVIDELKIWGLADAYWQTYAWSGTYLSPNADLYQYHNNATLPGVGVAVDDDEIIDLAALGAWLPTTPSTGDDDVLPEYIENTDTGAVMVHYGAGVCKPAATTTWGTWNAMGRPVTQMPGNRWTDYIADLQLAGSNHVAAIASAVALALPGTAAAPTLAQITAAVQAVVSGDLASLHETTTTTSTFSEGASS